MRKSAERTARRASEHLFEEGGDVVPAAIQARPDDLHADALEVAARALDLGDAGPIRLDHDQRGVEVRPEDRRVAVDVRRGKVEDDEVEMRAELVEDRGDAGRVEERRRAERRVSAADREQVRHLGRKRDLAERAGALDELREAAVAPDAEYRVEARRAEVRLDDRDAAAAAANEDRPED